jgi:hypothetical protein
MIFESFENAYASLNANISWNFMYDLSKFKLGFYEYSYIYLSDVALIVFSL